MLGADDQICQPPIQADGLINLASLREGLSLTGRRLKVMQTRRVTDRNHFSDSCKYISATNRQILRDEGFKISKNGDERLFSQFVGNQAVTCDGKRPERIADFDRIC